jgi:hypothetical protein
LANRPTKRDRREAAKRERIAAQKRAAKQRRKNRFYAVVAVLAVGGLIGGIVVASKKPAVNKAALNAAATAAGCDTLVNPPDQGRTHIQPPQTVNYDSNPPTSGNHYSISGVAPAPTGVHTSPIQDEDQVHNLEHSHIGIQYSAALPSDIRDSLEEFTRSHPTFIFMAPRPQLPTGVVLAFTAWDNLISCKSPTSVAAVRALAGKFFEQFQGRGPEGALPGTPLQ